jgi:hypothetical protein
MRTIIACVGGFLGAGKTTALQAAAAEIERRRKTAHALDANAAASGLKISIPHIECFSP